MKKSQFFLPFFLTLLITPVFAYFNAPPVVTRNVHVLRNITPSACPRAWHGSGNDETVTDLSEYGGEAGTAVGVLSCTHCAYDNASQDCVCAVCYDYLN